MLKQILTIGIFLFSTVFCFGQSAQHTDTINNTGNLTVDCEDPQHPAEPEMIFVEGGVFWMGCTDEQSDCQRDEFPVHQVEVKNFHIAKFLIMQSQWNALMYENPSNFLKGKDYPVENVSWHDIQEFINRLNAATGKEYRLPTEAEWEYAARGGNKSLNYLYSGSNDINDVAWFWSNSHNSTHPVGSKQPNELGIYDMSGNVAEWCSDLYVAYSEKGHNTNENTDLRYVLRGGRWSTSARMCRVASRSNVPPTYRHPDVGFRLVVDKFE
jgi:formylglycine-generating enzyme required for sulfatase activity